MATKDLTKTLADLAETRDWLRRLAAQAQVRGRRDTFTRRADAVDAAIRFIEEKAT